VRAPLIGTFERRILIAKGRIWTGSVDDARNLDRRLILEVKRHRINGLRALLSFLCDKFGPNSVCQFCFLLIRERPPIALSVLTQSPFLVMSID
jgi:hypothetical protein